MQRSAISVSQCFTEAFRLIFSPGFRRFIVIPLILNLIVFIAISVFAVDYAQKLLVNLESYFPEWLLWLQWLLWPLLILILLIAYGYSFNLITTIIATPFLGFLAEKVEVAITDKPLTDESLMQLLPRTFKRELTKLLYFIPRSLGIVVLVFLFIFFPGANLLGVVLGGLWGSWCLALQFCDYAADNRKITFKHLRTQLSQKKISSFTFGGLVLLGSMTPIINIVITPLAVAAGTIYWIRLVDAK